MRTVARGIQFIGLVIPLTGMFLTLDSTGGSAMTYSFGGLAVGALVFWIGWTLQHRVGG